VKFDEPFLLLALAVLPPIVLMEARRFDRRSKAFFALVGRGTHSGPSGERGLRRRSFHSALFFALSLSSAILALAGPSWGTRLIPEYRRGLDVALAMDVSRSMDASDLFPSRLRRAALTARTFVEASPGIRFAVVLGKGDGVVAVPLTDDAESVLALLTALSSGSLTSRGTDLERLVETALKAFPSSSSSRRLVVLFSDGESLSGDLSGAAAKAASQGIPIAAVGLGTEAGAPVPVAPGSKELVRSADGRPVTSVLRESALRSLAQPTGGAYYDGSRGDTGSSLASLAAGLSSVAAADGFRREPIPRYPLFLFLSLSFFVASKLAETLPKRRRP